MCSSTSKAVTRPQVRERTGSSLASARTARMPLACATSATESEYSSARASHPCAFSTLVLPPPAAPMSSARPGPGSRRSSRPRMARRSLYHQWRSSREVSNLSSAVSTASLLQHPQLCRRHSVALAPAKQHVVRLSLKAQVDPAGVWVPLQEVPGLRGGQACGDQRLRACQHVRPEVGHVSLKLRDVETGRALVVLERRRGEVCHEVDKAGVAVGDVNDVAGAVADERVQAVHPGDEGLHRLVPELAAVWRLR